MVNINFIYQQIHLRNLKKKFRNVLTQSIHMILLVFLMICFLKVLILNVPVPANDY